MVLCNTSLDLIQFRLPVSGFGQYFPADPDQIQHVYWVYCAALFSLSYTLHTCRLPLPTFNVQRVDDVMVKELKVFVADPVLDIAFSAREEVVHDCHLVSFHHQLIHQMRADKTRPSCHLQKEFTEFSTTTTKIN